MMLHVKCMDNLYVTMTSYLIRVAYVWPMEENKRRLPFFLTLRYDALFNDFQLEAMRLRCTTKRGDQFPHYFTLWSFSVLISPNLQDIGKLRVLKNYKKDSRYQKTAHYLSIKIISVYWWVLSQCKFYKSVLGLYKPCLKKAIHSNCIWIKSHCYWYKNVNKNKECVKEKFLD